MPPARELTPGHVVTYPNRQGPASHTARGLVIATLAASIALILAVTIGGWSELAGLRPVNLIWCALYALIAVYVSRWSRGLLPIAIALAALMLAISVAAGTGATGTSWFDRANDAYAPARSMFGGPGLSATTLGVLTLFIAPFQVLVIAIASYAFGQAWNVELEIPVSQTPGASGGAPAAS